MFGLDVDTDLAAFQGCELESFSVSAHQVQLRCNSLRNVGVSIEGDFAVIPAGGPTVMYRRPPDAAGALAGLLGAEIAKALVTSPGTVSIRFSDGTVIEIYDSEEHYESYQINIGERLILV
ncbi:DUF6188 family protein [Streptomyces sp.]|jgi:hypothetical protein